MRATPSAPSTKVWLPWVTVAPAPMVLPPVMTSTEYAAVLAKPEAPLVPDVFTCVAASVVSVSFETSRAPVTVSIPEFVTVLPRFRVYTLSTTR